MTGFFGNLGPGMKSCFAPRAFFELAPSRFPMTECGLPDRALS
jgi:hypothetical protein